MVTTHTHRSSNGFQKEKLGAKGHDFYRIDVDSDVQQCQRID